MAPPPKPVQAQNPYAEIVGDGPYGKNGATYTTPTPLPTEPKAMRLQNRKKVDFTPYFDPSDTRNDKDLRSSKRVSFDAALETKSEDSFRPVLGAKTKNAKLHQKATDTEEVGNKTVKVLAAKDCSNMGAFQKETVISKRSGFVKEKILPAVPMSPPPPRTPVKMDAMPKTPTTPTKLRSILEDVALPRSLEGSEVEGKRTAAKESKRLSAIVEAPSPLKLSTKKSTDPRPLKERTPTLDQIVKLRAEEQAKALAALEGTPQESGQRASVPETQHKKKTSREEKRKGVEFIPNLDLGDSIDWGKSFYESTSPPPVPPKSAKRNLTAAVEVDDGSSSVYSSDEEDDIEKLTQAIAGLHPFQDLPSSTPRTSFPRRSAVPEGLDLEKIKAVKGRVEELSSKDVPREKTSDEAMAEVLEALEATEAAARGERSLKESSSKESFATLSSDDYEQVGSPTELETDENGVKRRWFKGFRKT
jgi:hypothetical protein